MPFMLFPALKIIENGIFYKFKSGRNSIAVKMSKNFYRVVISVACAALAFGIGADNLDKFVSLGKWSGGEGMIENEKRLTG